MESTSVKCSLNVISREGPPARYSLALPGRQPPIWVILGASIGALAFGAVVLSAAAANAGPNEDDAKAVSALALLGVGAVTLGIYLPSGQYLRYWRRTWALSRAAAKLGMRFDARTSGSELVRYRDVPLMAFARGWSVSAANALEDRSRDSPVRLLDIGYQGSSGTVYQRIVQTVAVLPAHHRGLRFAFGEYPSTREDVYPQWAFDQGFTTRLDLDAGGRACVLHAAGRADLKAIVPEEVVESLRRLWKWCIESDGENLFIYEPGELLDPNRIVSFLAEVRAIESVATRLSVVAEDQEASDAARQPAERPSRAVQKANPSALGTALPTQPRPAGGPTRSDDEDLLLKRRLAASQVEFALAGVVSARMALPGREPPLWACVGAWLLGALVLGLLGAFVVHAAQNRRDLEDFPVFMATASAIPLLLGAGLYAIRARWTWRIASLARACKSIGGRRRRMSSAFRESIAELPMLRFGSRGDVSTSRYAAEASLGGVSLRLFDVGMRVRCPDTRGVVGCYRAVQTVAILELPGTTARFHAGPLATPWDWINFDWSREQCLFSIEAVLDPVGRPVALVRATVDSDVPDAIRPLLLSEDALIVEGSSGLLMVYHLGRTVGAGELPEFLDRVARVLKAFR